MGKKSYEPPIFGINASLRCLSWRCTITLIALASLVLQSEALLYAEAPASLVISKDGANVNVSLDSQASSDVSIRRSDDLMMIKVPKSFSSKLVIDPGLKKDETVQETETESGKTILIHSQQIYLMTQENLQDKQKDGSTKPTTHPGKTSTPKQATEADKSAQPSTDTGGNTTIDKQPSPTTKSKAQLHQPPTIPLKIPTILSDTESEPTADKSHKTKPAASSTNDGVAKTNITAKSVTNPEPVDPESLPIDLSGKEQMAASKQSTSLMIRVTLSLVAVLALLIGFIQVGLPKLMARYPEFFENLQQQARMKQGNALTQDGDDPDVSPASPRRSPKSGLSAHHTPKRSFNAPVQVEPDSKRGYLERMSGGVLSVLSSASIGKGSELHLVEVQGRQLVIATTPYTVSFVTDLTDGAAVTESTFELNAEPRDAEPMEYHLPSTPTAAIPQIASIPSVLQGTMEVTETEEQQTTQTIAYLSDDSPIIPTLAQPKAKPYASVPHTTRQASINPPDMVPAAQANLPKADAIHQKYLGDLPPHAQPAAKPPYVDAEEIIVLEDYDDVYGS